MRNTYGIESIGIYRDAVASHSPGLPGTGYPGNMSPQFINPNGVVSSSGIDVPLRTQPRWGKLYHRTPTQGSRCAATLRSVTESRWDKYIYRNAVLSISPGLARRAYPGDHTPRNYQPHRGWVLFGNRRAAPDATPLGQGLPPSASLCQRRTSKSGWDSNSSQCAKALSNSGNRVSPGWWVARWLTNSSSSAGRKAV